VIIHGRRGKPRQAQPDDVRHQRLIAATVVKMGWLAGYPAKKNGLDTEMSNPLI
jgi:hypothetical protein